MDKNKVEYIKRETHIIRHAVKFSHDQIIGLLCKEAQSNGVITGSKAAMSLDVDRGTWTLSWSEQLA